MSTPAMTETQSIRVVLVDDQLLFRAGIRTLIDRGNGITVVGDAGSRGEALALVQSEQPDVILSELELRGESGLEYIPDMIAAAGKAKVLILTNNKDQDLHRKAVHLGAKGLIFKDISVEVLTKAIEKVYAGEVWLDRSMTAVLLDELSHKNNARKLDPEERKIATLTDREREVIGSVGEGLKTASPYIDFQQARRIGPAGTYHLCLSPRPGPDSALITSKGGSR
jgi:two-component system nitrate/nitrite response regulator NarL